MRRQMLECEDYGQRLNKSYKNIFLLFAELITKLK